MPLKKIRLKLSAERPAYEEEKNEPHFSALIIIMPLCIAIGILSGKFLLSETDGQIIDATLTVSLIFLYTGVGVSIGSNKEVFSYIRKLGFRIIFMPAAIFTGCIAGGTISGLLLGVPVEWSALSASGMGYYSLTGAFLTESFGVEAGTYGFIVNVSRDVLTVILLPLFQNKRRQPHSVRCCGLHGYYACSRNKSSWPRAGHGCSDKRYYTYFCSSVLASFRNISVLISVGFSIFYDHYYGYNSR